MVLSAPFPMKLRASAVNAPLPGFEHVDRVMAKFDPYRDQVDALGERLLGQTIPWPMASQLATFLFLISTVLVMFARPDFPNLAVGLVGFYYIASKGLNAVIFKLLTLGLAFLVLYDMIWLMIFAGPWGGGGDLADGAENGVKRFSLFMSFINLILKVPVGIVYWRNSLGAS